MFKGFNEIIKANKKRIVKSALVLGGTIVGLVIVSNLVGTKEDDSDITDFDAEVMDIEATETTTDSIEE